MNAIEDRLRDAYRAAADTVGPESIPALPDAPAPGQTTPRRATPGRAWPARLRWRRLAIPVAAAAAVSLIATTAWLARPDGGRPGGLGPPPGGGAAAPPFILGESESDSGSSLAVYSATTGKVLARIPAPGRGLEFFGTAATSNSRSFVVSAVSTKACYTRFYRLLLSPGGRLASLTPLDVPPAEHQLAYEVAASADGKTVAYTADGCHDGAHGWVGVLHVGSQAARTWPLSSNGARNPALSPDGRVLYFVNLAALYGDGTVRALRTDAPAGPVNRRARIVLPASRISDSGSITLARHGRVLLVCSPDHQVMALTAYSAATGARLAVIHTWPHDPSTGSCGVTATPAGNRALVWGLLPGLGTRLGTRVDLATGRAQPVPGHLANPPGGLTW